MHRPLFPKSNQSGLLTVTSVCLRWLASPPVGPSFPVMSQCVSLALRTNFLLSNLFVREILFFFLGICLHAFLVGCRLYTLLQIVLFVHVSVLCLITTVCCEWSDDSCFSSVVRFGASFSHIAYLVKQINLTIVVQLFVFYQHGFQLVQWYNVQ